MAALVLSQPLNSAAPVSADDTPSILPSKNSTDSKVTDAMQLAPEVNPPVEVVLPDVGALQEKVVQLELVERVDTSEMLPTYSEKDVAQHKSLTDLWVIVAGDVYDMSEFQKTHPGGFKVLAGVAGKDATKKFDKYHRRGILALDKHKQLIIGKVGAASESKGGGPPVPALTAKTEEKKKGFGRWFK